MFRLHALGFRVTQGYTGDDKYRKAEKTMEITIRVSGVQAVGSRLRFKMND